MNRSDAAAGAVVAILDDVLWLVGVPGELAKADRSALTRSGFRLLVNALVVAMRHETREPQRRAIRGAVARIEREWPRLATGDRERALAGALGQLRVGMVEAALGVGEPMAASVRGTIAATRQAAAARHRLTVPEVFSLRDQQAVDHARRSAELFVRTRFGDMVDGPLATVVRATVAKGIEDGVDPQQIGRDLEKALLGTAAQRTQAYFTMVASTATARARTWGILNSFREASIPRYQVQSVRDEHTCPVCFFMHGKVFDVGASLDAFAAAAAAPPQDVGNHQPFMGVGRIGGVLHVGARTAQGFVPIATYLPGAGPASEGGRLFQQLEPADRIQRLGCGCPFHPHCRCLLVPVFGRVQVPATAPVGPAAAPAAPVAPPPAVTRPPTPAAPPPPPAPAPPVPAVATPGPPPVPTPRSPAPATPTTPAAPPRGRRSRSSPTTASPGASPPTTPTNVPKLRVVRGRPVVGPPVKTLSPSDAVIEWSAMKPGSTIEVDTLKQVFGRRVPRLSELMRAWTDHETGSVTTITGLRASGGRISIDFMIRDAQGLPVTEGEGTRIISRDANGRLGVYHSFLRTYSEARGVGRRLTQNSIALYTRLGVDEVTVGPAWAGKYTWASFGFDWEPVDAENHRNGFAAHLVKRFGLSWIEADIHAARADYSRPWLLGSYRIGRKVTVEVDQASRVHGSFIHREECDAGKSYLLEGPGWHGTLTLDDVASPSWQRCWSRVFLDEKGP